MRKVFFVTKRCFLLVALNLDLIEKFETLVIILFNCSFHKGHLLMNYSFFFYSNGFSQQLNRVKKGKYY